MSVVFQVVHEGLRPDIHSLSDREDLVTLMQGMWDQDLAKRPTAAEVAATVAGLHSP